MTIASMTPEATATSKERAIICRWALTNSPSVRVNSTATLRSLGPLAGLALVGLALVGRGSPAGSAVPRTSSVGGWRPEEGPCPAAWPGAAGSPGGRPVELLSGMPVTCSPHLCSTQGPASNDVEAHVVDHRLRHGRGHRTSELPAVTGRQGGQVLSEADHFQEVHQFGELRKGRGLRMGPDLDIDEPGSLEAGAGVVRPGIEPGASALDTKGTDGTDDVVDVPLRPALRHQLATWPKHRVQVGKQAVVISHPVERRRGEHGVYRPIRGQVLGPELQQVSQHEPDPAAGPRPEAGPGLAEH